MHIYLPLSHCLDCSVVLCAASDALLARTAANHGHLVLTPLILTQPSGLQGTAAECGQTGLGMEEAEAMDMERD
eukprot:SAG25_NODE_181_length_12544_cov_32.416472_6_plen_74_part_00